MICKSTDWFLYDNGLRHERVKAITQIIQDIFMALVLRHIYGTISGKNSKGTKSIYTNIAFDAKICLIYPKFLRKKTKFHDECSLEAL